MNNESTIGARLRTLRRWRGMTQVQLAHLAGLSQPFLSQVERGQSALDRRSHISALAAALRISETEIIGGSHLSADPTQFGPHMVVPAIRVALQTNTLASPGAERARPLSELVAEMARIEPFHQACNYLEVGQSLPWLLDELHLHVCEPTDESAYRIALETLVQACTAATFTTKDLGYPDLAHLAAVRAEEAAAILDDPVHHAQADFLRIHTMPRAGSWNRTLITAERAANRLQAHASEPLGRQVLGMLALSASLAAAVNHDVNRARDWIGEAADLATHLPDAPDKNWMSFSATNVAVWNVAVNVECGERGKAVLELAEAVDESKLIDKRGRHAAFLVDIGRGLARDLKTKGEAVRWLRRAEDIAPQWIRNSAPVRHTLEVLREQALAPAVGVELRGMMARMGIPH